MVDPITLTGLALAAGGGAASAGLFGGSAPTPATPTAPAAPPPQQSPQGSPTGQPTSVAGGGQPTFLGSAATPPVQSGQKSLLGQ